MSKEAARDFIQRADHDSVIRQLARDRFSDIVDVGREFGYEFAWDEFDQVMRQRSAAGQGQGPGRDDHHDGGGHEDPGYTSDSCLCEDVDNGQSDTSESCLCPDDDQRDDDGDDGGSGGGGGGDDDGGSDGH